jgi:hypothetical protein
MRIDEHIPWPGRTPSSPSGPSSQHSTRAAPPRLPAPPSYGAPRPTRPQPMSFAAAAARAENPPARTRPSPPSPAATSLAPVPPSPGGSSKAWGPPQPHRARLGIAKAFPKRPVCGATAPPPPPARAARAGGAAAGCSHPPLLIPFWGAQQPRPPRAATPPRPAALYIRSADTVEGPFGSRRGTWVRRNTDVYKPGVIPGWWGPWGAKQEQGWGSLWAPAASRARCGALVSFLSWEPARRRSPQGRAGARAGASVCVRAPRPPMRGRRGGGGYPGIRAGQRGAKAKARGGQGPQRRAQAPARRAGDGRPRARGACPQGAGSGRGALGPCPATDRRWALVGGWAARRMRGGRQMGLVRLASALGGRAGARLFGQRRCGRLQSLL